jgi:hypothetical protein
MFKRREFENGCIEILKNENDGSPGESGSREEGRQIGRIQPPFAGVIMVRIKAGLKL